MKDHELVLKIKFKTDEEMSDFEEARKAIIHLLDCELKVSLADEGIIEDEYAIEEIKE